MKSKNYYVNNNGKKLYPKMIKDRRRKEKRKKLKMLKDQRRLVKFYEDFLNYKSNSPENSRKFTKPLVLLLRLTQGVKIKKENG